MIRAGEDNDAVPAGGQQRRLECGLDGLETGVAENCPADFLAPVLKGDAAQLAGQFGLSHMRMEIAHRVRQPGELLLAGLDDARIRVTGGGDSKRGGQIQIFFPVGVPNKDILGAVPDNRPRAVRLDERDVARLGVAKLIEYDFGFRHKFTANDLRFTRLRSFQEPIVNHKS